MRLGREDGMGIVEALTAALILIVGSLATLSVLDGSRRLTSVSERREVALHRAERELERVRAIAYADLGLSANPGAPAAGNADDPRSWVGRTTTPMTFDWDLTTSGATNPPEPIVLTTGPDAITSRATAMTGDQFSATMDTFVTQAATGLKRVTVAVRMTGPDAPRRPIVMSTLVSAR